MMSSYNVSFFEPLASLIRNRGLIYSLIKRDISGRYQGSFLGIFWAIANPIFMLSVYTFVFTVIFKSRWAGGTDSKIEFALLLFCGLIIFNIFAECINRAPVQITSNANYVKKVVFPLEVLPWVTMGASLFHALVSFIVWIVAYAIFIGLPPMTIFLLPLVLMPLIMLIMGFSWFLASLGVYLRDLGQLVIIFTTVLMFLSPIFYPASALPENYHGFFMLNPLVPIIEQVRSVMYWGYGPDWVVFGGYLISGAVIAWLGLVWFQKTRMGFADVI